MKVALGTVLVGCSYLLMFNGAAHAVSFVPWPIPSAGNGHLYGLTDLPLNWSDAENAAVALGGHLVSVNSAEEQAFLETTFLAGSSSDQIYWIGLTDIPNGAGSRIYDEWTSGEPVIYANWNPGEPNNYIDPDSGSGEDYVALNWTYAIGYPNQTLGTWNDVGLHTLGEAYGIIEIVPETSSLALAFTALFGLAVKRRSRLLD
jgi:Lectin C-type domain